MVTSATHDTTRPAQRAKSAATRPQTAPNVRLHTDKWWAQMLAPKSDGELEAQLRWRRDKLDHPHPRATERARLVNEDAVRHIAAEIERRAAGPLLRALPCTYRPPTARERADPGYIFVHQTRARWNREQFRLVEA